MPPQHPSEESTTGQLSIIDSLSALPFPEEEGKPGTGKSWGGPGFHLVILRESRNFWEDRSAEAVEAAERELEANVAALTEFLSGRWGAPEAVDLGPDLGFDDLGPGVGAREPLSFLCGVAGSMQVWRLPNSERWVGLAIGQADPEWPLQVLAAVGDASSLVR